MSAIDLRIRGEPVPQPRVKGRIAGRPGQQFIQIYTPSTADEWKASVRESARRVMGNRTAVGPLRVCAQFLMPRPGSHYLTAGLRTDNLVKAVLDALTDAGAWQGDGQVCQLYAEKRYTPALAEPGARVLVSRVVPEFMPELFAEVGA
jgi:Holliday junction resolvase RusA-like endonuclease